METKWVIEIACNSQSEAERTRDWLAYYSFGPDRVAIVEQSNQEEYVLPTCKYCSEKTMHMGNTCYSCSQRN